MIVDLSAHPRFVPQLTDAFFAEWPEWCRRVGRGAVERIFEAGPGGALPVILVAVDGEEVVGTVALRPWYAEEPVAETPWVRQLLVLPAHRGRGAYRALARAVIERARAMGFSAVYAATNRIEPLLGRQGWQVLRQVEHDGERMAHFVLRM